MPKFTLDEIAKQAGVAKSTVYRVLNNAGSASSETRQRIQAAIAVLEKNADAARTTNPESTHHLAVVYPSVWNPQREGLYRVYYRAIYHAASELGFMLHLISAQADESSLRLVEEFQEEGLIHLESVVVMGLNEDDETLLAFQQRGIPVCFLGRYLSPNSHFSWVSVNYQEGAALAFRHLTGLGHRRIVLANQGHASSSYHQWHVAAYQHVMEEIGSPFNPSLIFDHAELAKSAIIEQVRQGATAIYATTDELGAALYQAVREQGYNVPQDVSIICFNDFVAADHNPPMTAIYWPHHMVGQLAVQILANLIETSAIEAQHIVLKPELHVRATTGPAPARVEDEQ